jgi:plasmid stabilization system protein ParE
LVTVILTDEAENDLKEIALFYIQVASPEVAYRNQATIMEDLDNIAADKFRGKSYPDAPDASYWYVLGTSYKVYFIRTEPTTIEVYRIYSSRRESITPDQIKRK